MTYWEKGYVDDAVLKGFVKPEAPLENGVLMLDDEDALNYLHDMPVRIYDARLLQAETGSAAKMLEEHSFALLEHHTEVTEWNEDPENKDNQLSQIHVPEIEKALKEDLLPGKNLSIEYTPYVVGRGPGMKAGLGQEYVRFIHTDYPITPDDYVDHMAAFTGSFYGKDSAAKWRAKYDSQEVESFVIINFWRPLIEGPLQHMPMCYCDPTTVRPEDIQPFHTRNFGGTGEPAKQNALRYHPDQKWYAFPEMQPGEVVVSKACEIKKDGAPQLTCPFHTSFEDPCTPADFEPRTSTEFRPLVMIMRD